MRAFVYRRQDSQACLACGGARGSGDAVCATCKGRGKRTREGRWYLAYEVDGKLRRESAGPMATRALALELLRKRVQDTRRREAYDLPEVTSITFRDFAAKHYLPMCSADNRPRTVSWKADVINKRLLPVFGNTPLASIQRKHVEAYKAKLAQSVSKSTCNRHLAVLGHLFTTAVNLGFASKNPVHEVQKFREPEGAVRFLTTEERERLLQYAQEHFRPVLLFALNTGLRRGELLQLMWDDVDFDRRKVRVRSEVAKSGKSRVVPLNRMAWEALQGLTKSLEDRHVFLGPDNKALTVDELRNAWERTVRKAKIRRFRFHDCRHDFASRLAMARVSIQEIRDLLGHHDLRMTLRYAHLSESSLQEAVSRLDSTPIATPQEGRAIG